VKTNYEQRHTSSADATRKATTALFHPTPPPPSTPTTADKPPAVPHSRRGGGGGGSPRRVPASQTARACAAGGGAAANASGSKRTKVGARIKVEGEAAAELGRAERHPEEHGVGNPLHPRPWVRSGAPRRGGKVALVERREPTRAGIPRVAGVAPGVNGAADSLAGLFLKALLPILHDRPHGHVGAGKGLSYDAPPMSVPPTHMGPR